MVKIGLFLGVVGVFSESVFFRDYWNPPLIFRFGPYGGIEDFIFGFAVGGIGTAIYYFTLHKRFRKKNHPHFWIIPTIGIIECLSLFILNYLLRINSIYASSIGLIIPSLIIMLIRKDLIIETILSAIMTAFLLVFVESVLLIFASGYLSHYYFLYRKVPLLFGLAPITELIWGISFGAIVGPLYDFDYGDGPVNFPHLKKRRRRKQRK